MFTCLVGMSKLFRLNTQIIIHLFLVAMSNLKLDLSFDMGRCFFFHGPQDSNLMTAISEQLTSTAHELTLVDGVQRIPWMGCRKKTVAPAAGFCTLF